MLEKEIERKVCDYAKSKGWLTYKFTSPSRRSVPDRLFISPGGKIIFIEFKRLTGKVTPGQEREHFVLRGHGQAVYVINNVSIGKLLIDEWMTRNVI